MRAPTSERVGAPRSCCGLQAVAEPRSAEPDASEYFYAACQVGTSSDDEEEDGVREGLFSVWISARVAYT